MALDKDRVPLDVDWGRYFAMERAGCLRGITVRRNGKLIGYSAFITTPHLHYKSTPYAINDVFYIDPEHRGLAGVRLIQQSEKLLREIGVRKVLYHVKLHVLLGKGSNRAIVGRLLERLGYRHIEEVYAKLL